MPSTVSTIICVCWWVVLGVITAPSFVQVTVVAGPPVEVQVRVLDSLSIVSSVTMGAPAFKSKRIRVLVEEVFYGMCHIYKCLGS